MTTDTVGGVWRYTMELAAGLRALGASPLILSMGPPPTPAQRAEAGAALHVTDLPLDWMAEAPADLETAASGVAAFARAQQVDSVHLHTPALVTCAEWPVPVVAMAHSCVGTWWRAVRGAAPMPADLAWRAALVAEGLPLAIAPSRSFADALADSYGVRVRSVMNGRAPIEVRRTGPRSGVLTAGRLWDEGKNVATLDRACARASIVARAAGPVQGPNGASITLQHMKVLGSLDEAALAREYARAAVFASVARYEPFGLSVLEAAQAGCALVLSDIPTFRELWDGAAMFVPPDDPDAIAAALEAARGDAAPLGLAARQRSRRYTREAMAAETLALHEMAGAA